MKTNKQTNKFFVSTKVFLIIRYGRKGIKYDKIAEQRRAAVKISICYMLSSFSSMRFVGISVVFHTIPRIKPISAYRSLGEGGTFLAGIDSTYSNCYHQLIGLLILPLQEIVWGAN